MAAKQNDSDTPPVGSSGQGPSTATGGQTPGFEAGIPGAPSGETRGPRFRVVGIGASAGGLEALTGFLQAMRPDSGVAFVVVSHLDPEHKSVLGEILSRVSAMPVREVEDGMAIVPNSVYVIPPNRDMVIAAGILRLTPRAETRVPQMPVDTFLRSLARDCGNHAIGVILSGTGTDGTLGLKAIKEEGGLAFAQDETARYSGMPRSAVSAGGVDAILPPADIAAELFRISSHPPLPHAQEAPPPGGLEQDEVFLQTLRYLSEATGVDFAHYKHSTLFRRIERRMVLRQMQNLARCRSDRHRRPQAARAANQGIARLRPRHRR
jgi:two-component system, chemotaxis family, CheB/CheR fusion protein